MRVLPGEMVLLGDPQDSLYHLLKVPDIVPLHHHQGVHHPHPERKDVNGCSVVITNIVVPHRLDFVQPSL